MTALSPRPLTRSLREAAKAVGCVCLIVLGLIAAAIVGLSVDTEQPKALVAQSDLRTLSGLLVRYERRMGRAPDSANWTLELISDGELDAVPMDPWGHPYVLERAAGSVRLVTLGRDGKPGGNGPDADLAMTVHAEPDAGR